MGSSDPPKPTNLHFSLTPLPCSLTRRIVRFFSEPGKKPKNLAVHWLVEDGIVCQTQRIQRELWRKAMKEALVVDALILGLGMSGVLSTSRRRHRAIGTCNWLADSEIAKNGPGHEIVAIL